MFNSLFTENIMRLVKSWVCMLYLLVGGVSALVAAVTCEDTEPPPTKVIQVQLAAPADDQSLRQIVLIQWLTRSDNSQATQSNWNY